MDFSEIFTTGKIKTGSRILIFDKNLINNSKNLELCLKYNINIDYYYSKEYNNDVEYSYDFLLFENYYVFKSEFKNLRSNLQYSKIMIIDNFITSYIQYYYHPLTFILDFLKKEQLYICEFYKNLNEYHYGLKIIDTYRLYSNDIIPTFPVEYFIITIILY